ncbi:hypothetical protein FSP39_013529 [Pinctada imbricata]|uniref:Uncharacterized protein n=1 Tax=Pinctada imbricata TaxID=66713 RepID=A0AA88XWJ2_PINIB|nr:hypothetical protein FSP39_013529 [Pinctada imbricata]
MPFSLFNKDTKVKIENDDLKWLVEQVEEYSNSSDLPEEKRREVRGRLEDIKQQYGGHDADNSKNKPAKVIQAQLYIPKHKELCQEVLKNLGIRLRERGIDLKTQMSDVRNPSLPMIAMCLGKSRIGADIDEVISPLIAGESSDNKAWVIIIHDLKEHALPLGRTEAVLLDRKYKLLAGYIDMAYQSNQGLYQCAMNDTALERLVSIFQCGSRV